MKRLSILCALLFVLPYMALATPVPDTGQTKCYDNTDEIPCPSPGEAFYGQDTQYIIYPQSYTKLDEDGLELPDSAPSWVMVRDNMTGLMWEVKTDDGSIHDKDNEYNLQDAQDVFIATLNSQQFSGYDDWRMPTIKELWGIVEKDTSFPQINMDYFPNTKPDYHWSSTTLAYSPSGAWGFHFTFPIVMGLGQSSSIYVRAVRGGQSSNNFRDNANGTVTDTSTGLMWEKKTDDGGIRDKDNLYYWQEALAYCENLILNNDGEWTSATPNPSGIKYDDWRLPSANELQSLVDYNIYDPCIDTNYFPNTKLEFHWSSSTTEYNNWTHKAWRVDFSKGEVRYGLESKTVYNQPVRAVRGGTALQFDVDQDGKPDGPVELLLCEEQTVALDIWLSNWDSTNNSIVTEAEYYLTWDDTWLDVLGVSCYDDAHGGPWDSGTCVISANDPGPGSYRLSVSESASGVPGHRMKLHTVTLKATNAPTEDAWMKASLVSDGGPTGSVTRVSGDPFDEDDIFKSENPVSTVCGSDPLEGPYDELPFDYQCPTTATPTPGENDYYELLNDQLQPDDTFCKGEMAIIGHTYLGSYPATLDNTPPICDSDCFNYKIENCKYVSGQGCYIKCIHGCRNGFCVDSASKCEEYQKRIKCNIISYFQCLNPSYVDVDCGFEINEMITVKESNGSCGGATIGNPYPLSDYGTAAREIPMPLQTGTYDICAETTPDPTLVQTVTVQDCGPACVIKIPNNKFEVEQGVTDHLEVTLETDEVGEYALSLDRFLDDAHTESMYVPSSLQVSSPVTIGCNPPCFTWEISVQESTGSTDSVSFQIDAIDPQMENGEIHWANILVMAEGPSVSCEATFNFDIGDGDGVPIGEDNCPSVNNPLQEDDYPPGGNSSPPTDNCGDACECEGDVQSASQGVGYPDGDVDGSDAFEFKQNFGRSDCATSPPCLRDHECDGDVDGSDAFKFKTDFGRSDCPSCVFECVY